MKNNVVRLIKGDPKKVTKYDHKGAPLEVARIWEKQGAKLIHVIDLDAVFGVGNNISIVLDLIKELDTPIQFGGGIRDIEKAQNLLSLGVYRVILGSMAVRNPQDVYALVSEFGEDRVAVALDHSAGLVVYKGWTKVSGHTLKRAIENHMEGGVKVFLVTSVMRDGTLEGPDIENLKVVTNKEGIFIIVAGGIGSIQDLKKLQDIGAGATVIGKALYEDRFTLTEALASIRGT